MNPFRALLSSQVQTFSCLIGHEPPGIALPASLAKAAPKRQGEFLAGRSCAREALIAAGLPNPGEISIGPDRAPLWPEGWVGSITHARGFAAAAVAPNSKLRALGIDAEAIMSAETAKETRSRIVNESEWSRFENAFPWTPEQLVTVIFSAKEALYKALRPLTGQFFYFEAAEIESLELISGHQVHQGRFKVSLTRDIGGGFAKGFRGEGAFVVSSEGVYTAFELEKSTG